MHRMNSYQKQGLSLLTVAQKEEKHKIIPILKTITNSPLEPWGPRGFPQT